MLVLGVWWTFSPRPLHAFLSGSFGETAPPRRASRQQGPRWYRAVDRPNPFPQSPFCRLIVTSAPHRKPWVCSSQPLARRQCSAEDDRDMGLSGDQARPHPLGVNIGMSRRRWRWRTLHSLKNLSGHSASKVYRSSRRLVLDLVPEVRHDSRHILEPFRNRCTVALEIPLKSKGLGCAEGPRPPEQIEPTRTRLYIAFNNPRS